ncbi:MAG: hypothetical protein Q4A36_03665 [Candidatus Saccharibacteria bacterium]|nr:hypothetical protein [Candidatus Saccharibacteria bacterium]
MGAQNSSNNKPYIITIFILIAILIGGGVYFLFFHKNNNSGADRNTMSPPAVANITDDTDATTFTKDTLLGKLDCIKDQKPEADYCIIDNSKILNAKKDITYTLTNNTDDFAKLAKVEIDKNDTKKATVKFDEKIIEQFYGVKGLNYPVYLTFSREIASYKIAGFGQGVGDEYIFFIMKDGSVGMLSVYSVVEDKKYDPYYVKGVKDVTAILEGSSYDEYSGGHTNYAVTKNQTAYDLETLMPGWNTTE